MSFGRWVVWLFACVVLAQEDPYCSVRYERLCQGKGPHVACQYPYRGAGPSCEKYTAIIFSNDLKRFILHYINRRRQKIASGHERVRGGVHLPKPEIMMLVQWDRELAYLAQRLADQCQFVHDDCRATVRYPYAGQTVGEVRWRRSGASLERGARRTIGRVLDAWWGERRRVHAKQVVSPFLLTARGAVWGHFSQLAVWTLRAMGCGAVHHGATRPRLLLVCDFSHTNMLGQRTISPGPLASCPAHTMRSGGPYPLLCGPPPVHNKQVVDEEHIIDDEAEEETDDDDDDDEDDKEVETTRKPTTEELVNVDDTKSWPRRPIRPIKQPNNDYQPVMQQRSTLDPENQPLMEQHRPEGIVTQHKMIDNYYQPRKQEHKTLDTDYQFMKQQYIKDKENQPIRQQIPEDSDSQPMRHQYKTVDRNQRISPAQDIRPIQDFNHMLNKPSRPILLDDEDYPYIRSTEDYVIAERPKHVKVETDEINRLVHMKNVNNRPRPIKADVEDRNMHAVIPLNDDILDEVRRPIRPQQEEDMWKTTNAMVSVIYRENPESLFRQKFNDELSSGNRQSDNRLPIRNREPETRNIPDTRTNGPQTRIRQDKTDNYKNSETRRKGEYKAHNGYNKKELEWNQRTYPLERWVDDDTKLQDMGDVIPLRKQTYPPVHQVTTVVVYRPTSLFSIRASLVLDKDEEEQLYHDTGFKLSTKNR